MKYQIQAVTDSRDFVLYYQLVRVADDAILYANETLNNVCLECWFRGIGANEVTMN